MKLQLDKELLVKLPKTSSSSSCKKRGASSDQEQPGREKDVALDVELDKSFGIPGVGITEGFSVVVDWLEGPGKGSTKFGKGSTKWGARGGLMQGWAPWNIRNSIRRESIANPESVSICSKSRSVTR